MIIKRKSTVSGKVRTRDIPVNPEDMISWEKGDASIHVIMPYLSDEDREFILSGITREEWQEAFAEEEKNT